MGVFEAVIFDLDGVLVDSEAWWDEARLAFAREHGRPWTDDDRAAVMGANSREWSATMRRRLDLPMSEFEIEQAVVDAMVRRYEAEGAPEIPGAVEAVRRLAPRYPLAVASSAHPEVIAAALRATGLDDAFRVVAASDEVAHGKPAPDVYLLAARRLGVAPAACLVVEDSLNGVLAGRAAGMTVVLVPNRSIPPAPGSAEAASYVLERIGDLDPDTLDRDPLILARGSRDGPRRPACNTAAVIERQPDAATETGAGSPAISAPPRAPVRPDLPGPDVHPVRRLLRYVIARAISTLVIRSILRLRVEGRERLPPGQYLMCFSHENWADPFILMACLPWRPRLYFFGPREEDMTVGGRNRLMSWVGNAVPYRPGKNDLLDATRRVGAVFAAGGVLAIAGEGRIHARETEILPLNEGAAYFALRSRVPIVPVAINGTTWIAIGSRVRVRIGDPLPVDGRPTRESIEALTSATHSALTALVADFPERRRPGRFGRWLTDLFNDWPEGVRPAE